MELSALVLLCCCLMFQGAYGQLIYRPVNIECTGNPLRITNISCRVKAIDWNIALINMSCVLVVPIRNAVIRMQVLKKDYSNQFKPFLIDVSFNICDIIDRRNFIPYGVIVWKLLKQYTNVNHTCPFSGQLMVRDGFLNNNVFPPFPHGLYVFSFLYTDVNSTHSDHLGTVKFYMQAMEQVKTKRKPKA